MATIKFYCRSKIFKLVPVYIRYSDGRDIDIRLMTPFRIFPHYWNEKKQILNANALISQELNKDQAKDIEDKFTQLKDAILRESFKLSAPPSPDWLKGVINTFYYKSVPTNETLTEYIDRFIKEAKSGKRLASSGTTKKNYTYGSCRVLTGFKQSFEKFCLDKKKQYNFNDIDQDFYNDFIAFFYARDCGANYVGRLIKNLKTIMRASKEEGLHNNTQSETKAFKTISEPVDNIYLTQDEVDALYKLDLSEKKHWELARDVFLVGVYTAQRYSDYSKINKNNIKVYSGIRVIELIQQKTGEKCIIPIKPELEAILKKYDYNLPKTYDVKVNEYIKKVGEEAKINDVIYYEQNRGGLLIKKKAFKHKLIKTHTSRRTGCSLMYLAGINVIDIMKISGHRKETEFLKYIKVDKQETAVILGKHSYYTGLKIVS